MYTFFHNPTLFSWDYNFNLFFLIRPNTVRVNGRKMTSP